MTYDVMTDELLERVVFVLECVLNNDYSEEFDSEGSLTALDLRPGWFEKQVDTPFLENYFRKVLSPSGAKALFSLKENRSPQQIEAAFEHIMPSEKARNAAKDLAGAGWESILRYLNSHSAIKRNIAEWMGELMQNERETFTSPFGQKAETFMERRHPGIWKFFAARKYAEELKELFPKLIDRATGPEFRLLVATKNVDEAVKRLLNEASHCYLFGNFLACLFVCRSAIGEAVKLRLIDDQDKVKESDTFEQLLLRALRRSVLDDRRHKMANAVRKKANEAVHGKKLPDERECIECFHQTRGVLEYLYGHLQ